MMLRQHEKPDGHRASLKYMVNELIGSVEISNSLIGLLRLQYDHEGHMDVNITELLDKQLADNVRQLANIHRLASDSDIPF